MLSFLTWRSEITDVMFAMTKIIDHLAHAEKVGSFEMVAATMKRLGRHPRESKSNYDHIVFVMMPCPKYDFDFGLMKGHDGPLSVTIVGMERYAGFSFSCALPPQTFQATLESDAVHGISWRARKLYESIAIRSHVLGQVSLGITRPRARSSAPFPRSIPKLTRG